MKEDKKTTPVAKEEEAKLSEEATPTEAARTEAETNP